MTVHRQRILLSSTNKKQRFIIFFSLSMLYMFRAVSPPIIRSSRIVHTAPGMCQACLLASSKQAWHIPGAVCTILELLMMGGETARNMYSIDNKKNIVKCCILFVYLKERLRYCTLFCTVQQLGAHTDSRTRSEGVGK